MNEAIEKIIERISDYEILNNLIPGSVYAILLEKLTPFKVQTGQVWADLILFYFLGVIIGRIGSLVVERFFRRQNESERRNKAEFAPYEEYVHAEKIDGKVRELSTINNMYRTFTAVAFCLSISVLFGFLWTLVSGWRYGKPVAIVLGCVALTLLFAKSYKKQTKYVSDRVRAVNANKNKDGSRKEL